jgi:carbonic anhydrase/acetyltransferase-like protein (isoleucine patch superfamily)
VTAVHPTALTDATATVSHSTRVDAFASIGRDCVVGDDVHVGSGARLLSGARVDREAEIGENAVVLAGVHVRRHAVVEPGSVVADAVPANAIVRGNPARIIGYVGGDPDRPAVNAVREMTAREATRVRGVRTVALTLSEDLRGSLMATEFTDLPFRPARLFTVFAVQGEHIRGSHAHRECHQFLVCAAGKLSCVVDDGEVREEILLDHPGVGLYLPPMIWGTQYKYSGDAVLLVLASHPYDPDDYVRDYDEFLRLIAGSGVGR